MTTHPSNAIQTQRLTKRFCGRSVLRSIDLQIASGECVVLTGGNGSGKTTLLRCLAAITRPTSGQVCWFGTPAAPRSETRRLIGMVSHESCCYADLTLRENILFAARMVGVSEPVRRAEEMLEQTGLHSFADRQLRQVSKGMRQRLTLARAFLHEPQILLLDEPFCGLDANGHDWLVEQLYQRRQSGCAICMATHDERPTRHLADRTLLLRKGWLETPSGLLNPSDADIPQRQVA